VFSGELDTYHYDAVEVTRYHVFFMINVSNFCRKSFLQIAAVLRTYCYSYQFSCLLMMQLLICWDQIHIKKKSLQHFPI